MSLSQLTILVVWVAWCVANLKRLRQQCIRFAYGLCAEEKKKINAKWVDVNAFWKEEKKNKTTNNQQPTVLSIFRFKSHWQPATPWNLRKFLTQLFLASKQQHAPHRQIASIQSQCNRFTSQPTSMLSNCQSRNRKERSKAKIWREIEKKNTFLDLWNATTAYAIDSVCFFFSFGLLNSMNISANSRCNCLCFHALRHGNNNDEILKRKKFISQPNHCVNASYKQM